MAVLLSPVGGVAAQFFTNAGVPLSGGKIYTYAAGTSTPQATYTTGAGNIQHSNPIVLDAAGRVPTGEIWLTDGLSYKFVLKDANDVLIATYDNIVGINSNFVNFVNQQEIQTATAGQTVFNLTTMEYQPGIGNLSVFVDGVNQYGPGAQYAYTETDSNTVTFVSGLHVGASVKFTTTEIQNSGVADASQIAYTYPDANAVQESVEARLAQTVSVKDFGAVGDGVTDDTVAIQNAIDSCESTKNTLYFPIGDYKITSTLDISNTQIVINGQSYLNQAPKIFGNFDGYLIDGSGTSTSDYRGPYFISGINFENTNNGSGLNSAGCLKLHYTGPSRIENCAIKAQGTCVYLYETISTDFDNCHLTGDSATNPNLYSRGYYGQGRNTRVNNGRTYGCFIGFEISGDSWVISQNNAEFIYGIIIRTSAISGLLVEGCHFETSSMVWTNANTLPTTTTTPWTDNGGTGTGWAGGITFSNTFVAIGDFSAPNGVRAPLFVLKTQSGFVGNLQIIGCSFAVGSSMATISTSFDRTAATSLISGAGVFISGTSGFIAPTTIPVDIYTSYVNFTPSSYGGQGGLVSGVSRLQFNDPSSYIDLSNGTAIYGYSAVSLLSTFNGNNGVQYNNGIFQPTTDNLYSCGAASKRWSVVYAGTGSINTSDANEKTEVFILSDVEKRVAVKLKSLIKRFKFKDAVKIKGNNARYHFGVIAQDVKAAFESEGLIAEEYGVFCSDELEDGSIRLGVRYDELMAFIIGAI